MKYCANCGNEMLNESRFCAHCGTENKGLNFNKDTTNQAETEYPQKHGGGKKEQASILKKEETDLNELSKTENTATQSTRADEKNKRKQNEKGINRTTKLLFGFLFLMIFVAMYWQRDNLIHLVLGSGSAVSENENFEDEPEVAPIRDDGDEEIIDSEEEEETTEDENAIDSNREIAAVGFESIVQNVGEPIEGGTLRVAVVSDPFTGIFNTEFSSINVDSQLYSFSNGRLLSTDQNFQYSEDGAATMELDQETNTVTITLRDDVLWHDGEQVTADDILFTHEVVGHPDYDGPRYGENFRQIVGMEEYKAGERDTISGITVVNDLTIEIEYASVGPQMLQAGGGVWAYASPRHYLGDLEVFDIESSPQVRENPIGYGAFRVTNIVPGESVEFEAFEDYFLGRPYIDNVIVERVLSSDIVGALRDTQYDYVWNMPVDNFSTWKDGFDGYELLGYPAQSFDYISFKLGTFDGQENHYDPNSKMANLNLRQAMAHALDINTVGEYFYDGLRYRATSHIIPNFGSYHNSEIDGYPYDLKRAEELLDEAGYVDIDEDGFREDPDGNELVINYAARFSSDVAEPIALHFIESWQEIGLNVQLLEGRLHETNTLYDRVQADDPEIDVFEGGWLTGSDPTPDGLYGLNTAFNFSRYVSEENTNYINQMLSKEAFDIDWRVDLFYEWQEYFMYEAAVLIPTFWHTEIQPVNNRVSTYSHSIIPGADINVYGLHKIQLLADEPISE